MELKIPIIEDTEIIVQGKSEKSENLSTINMELKINLLKRISSRIILMTKELYKSPYGKPKNIGLKLIKLNIHLIEILTINPELDSYQ